MAAASFVLVDGLFFGQGDNTALATDFEIRPIDADSHMNQADFESPKFPFELKNRSF
jgi:hypothetical protein